jgi:hypothetical protein
MGLGSKESNWEKIGCPVKKVLLLMVFFLCENLKITMIGDV